MPVQVERKINESRYKNIFEWLYKIIWLILGIFAVVYLNSLNENIKSVSNKIDATAEIIAYKNNVDVVKAIDVMSETVSDAIDNLRILR